jgi:hypothetical protein
MTKPKDFIHYLKDIYPKLQQITPKEESKLISNAGKQKILGKFLITSWTVNDDALAHEMQDMEKKGILLATRVFI